RRAHPGYSTGGGGGGRLRLVTSSTAVSSAGAASAPGCVAVAGATVFAGTGAKAGCGACCASTGIASASTAAPAINRDLVRITLRDIDLDNMRRPLLGNGGQEDERANNEDDHDDQDGNSGHGRAFAEGASRCI